MIDHRGEFYDEIQEEMKTKSETKLAVKTAKWEEEKGRANVRTDRSADEAIALIKNQRKRSRTTEQDLQASFSKGKEQGEKNAVAKHATRRKSLDEGLANKKKQLQIRENKLGQEKKRLEGLDGNETAPPIAEVAAQAQKVPIQAQHVDRLSQKGRTYEEKLRRQASEKNEEIKQVQAEMVSSVESLQQQLAAKNRETTRLQNQLVDELLNHQEAMRASIREQTRREQALIRSYTEELRQLRTGHPLEQQDASGASMNMDNNVSGLTGRMSSLNVQLETSDRTLEPANSTDGHNQQILLDQQSSNEQLRQDLARQNASNGILQQSLAESKPRKENQPPVGDYATRLQDLQAPLEQKHACELEQAARRLEGFKRYAAACRADQNAEFAKATAEATAKAEKEKQRSQNVIASLEKEMEVSHAELEWQEKFSRNARWTIQSLQDREKELGEDKRRLFHAKKELEASLSQRVKDCKGWSVQVKVLKASLKRTERTMEAAQGEVMEMTEVKESAKAEAHNLRAANRVLGAEKKELEAKSSFAIAELNAAFMEVDRCQLQSEHLTAELRRVGDRFAQYKAIIKKEVGKAHELEELVDRRLEAWEKWKEVAPPLELAVGKAQKGEKEAAPPLELVIRKAQKGEKEAIEFLPRPMFPGLKDLVFWLLVAFLLVASSAALAANRQRRIWTRVDKVTRHVTVLLRAGRVPELWEDPLLVLSRGMYGEEEMVGVGELSGGGLIK